MQGLNTQEWKKLYRSFVLFVCCSTVYRFALCDNVFAFSFSAVVCLSSHISQNHSTRFQQMFRTCCVVGTRSSSDDNAIRYVLYSALDTLWKIYKSTFTITITSGFSDDIFYSVEHMGRNQRRRVSVVQFARWRHRGHSLSSPTAACYWPA